MGLEILNCCHPKELLVFKKKFYYLLLFSVSDPCFYAPTIQFPGLYKSDIHKLIVNLKV